MESASTDHPDHGVLVAFGLGKLPPSEVAAIQSHLGKCAVCCETLARLEGDSFVELVRRSQGVELGTDSDSKFATLGVQQFGDDAVASLPPALAEHPRYRILRLLGRGGMGVVYAAEHRLMNRLVALKVIRPNLITRPEAVARFRREVQAAAKLAHPNIVTAYDAEEAGGLHFLVMEYVDGTSLSQLVEASGPLPIATACDYARQVAEALEYAHHSGMVHRDVKPQNVMAGPTGRVKVLDFGIASLMESTAEVRRVVSGDGDAHGSADAPSGRLTEAGILMGTPEYVAPEQVANPSAADIRGDIYSLGCTLYYLLAGRPPFAEGTPREKLRAHVEQFPLPLAASRHDVPAELDAVVERMMAKNPADRYATPAEVAEALEPFADKATTVSVGGSRFRRVAIAAAGMAALLMAAAAAVIYIATDKGTLEIETQEPNVQVVLTRYGETYKVVDLSSESVVERLPSGEYNVQLRDDALKLEVQGLAPFSDYIGPRGDMGPEGFVLSRGGHMLVRVVRRPLVTGNQVNAAVAAPTGPAQPPVAISEATRIWLDAKPVGVTPIAVRNGMFEMPLLADGGTTDVIPEWNVDAKGGGTAGIQNLSDADFAGASENGSATTLPEGHNVAFGGAASEESAVTISQRLPVKVEAGTEYIVNVSVGRRARGGWPHYGVALVAGGNVLAEDDNKLEPMPGEFLTSIVSFVAGAAAKEIGESLVVRLSVHGAAGQADDAEAQFDRVAVYSRVTGMYGGPPAIALSWHEVPGAGGFFVERSRGRRTGHYEYVTQVGGDVYRYVDADMRLEPGQTYYYRVREVNWSHVRSGPVGVTTLDQPPTYPRATSGAHELTPLEERALVDAEETDRPLTNGDFRSGLDGWHIEGGAHNFNVFDNTDGKALTTYGENREADCGRLFQSFRVPDDAEFLSFKLHGGNNPDNLYCAVWEGDVCRGRFTARNDNTPFAERLDLTPLRGEIVTLEIVDKSSGPWGFIGAEDFQVVPPSK